MHIDAVMKHLEAAANSITPKASVETGSGALKRMTRAPGVIIYPTDGNARRDGSKVARTPGTPHGFRYQLFKGQMDYAVRVLAKDDVQLTEMLNQFLEYLFVHRLHDDAENHIAVPSDTIRFAWRDPEGVLMGDHTVELLIPAQAALYSDRERKLVDIVLSYEIANSLEGDDLNG